MKMIIDMGCTLCEKNPQKKARRKDFFQLSLDMPSVMIQGINWRKKRNNDDGIIEPQ